MISSKDSADFELRKFWRFQKLTSGGGWESISYFLPATLTILFFRWVGEKPPTVEFEKVPFTAQRRRPSAYSGYRFRKQPVPGNTWDEKRTFFLFFSDFLTAWFNSWLKKQGKPTQCFWWDSEVVRYPALAWWRSNSCLPFTRAWGSQNLHVCLLHIAPI